MRNILMSVVLATTLSVPVAFADNPKTAQPAGKQQPEFAALDKNKDGKLAKDEVRSDPAITEHFAMLDADQDGALSRAEFAKHQQ